MSRRSQLHPKVAVQQLECHIPPTLRPLIRAFLVGYVSAVAPRVLAVLLQRLSRKRQAKDSETQQNTLPHALLEVLRKGFDPQGFPTFCANLVGGSLLLQARAQPLHDV